MLLQVIRRRSPALGQGGDRADAVKRDGTQERWAFCTVAEELFSLQSMAVARAAAHAAAQAKVHAAAAAHAPAAALRQLRTAQPPARRFYGMHAHRSAPASARASTARRESTAGARRSTAPTRPSSLRIRTPPPCSRRPAGRWRRLWPTPTSGAATRTPRAATGAGKVSAECEGGPWPGLVVATP